jgi:GT2 family glycosyltransferase
MKISVVICTCDRVERLSGALASCLRQRLLPMEIIVVDDGSLAEEFLLKWREKTEAEGIGFVYIRKPAGRQGLTISRNIGWQRAEGEIIQFLDDDAELHPDCLVRLDEIFAADRKGELAGVDFPILEQARAWRGRRIVDFCYKLAGWWEVGRHFYASRPSAVFLSDFEDVKPVRFLQGGSMAIRRTMLERIGGFDETLGRYACGEDKDISLRLAWEGTLARIEGLGVVHHSDPGGRIGALELGIETSYNYLYINRKQGPFGMGERLMIGYNLGMLLLIEAALMVVGDRRSHWQQIKGILIGIRKFAGTLWRSKTA